MGVALSVDQDRVAEFCRRWRISELALFGSVLRDDFRAGSDVDVLVTFEAGVHWSHFDIVDARRELGQLLGREVDLVSKRGLRNPFRRHEILTTREVIFPGGP